MRQRLLTIPFHIDSCANIKRGGQFWSCPTLLQGMVHIFRNRVWSQLFVVTSGTQRLYPIYSTCHSYVLYLAWVMREVFSYCTDRFETAFCFILLIWMISFVYEQRKRKWKRVGSIAIKHTFRVTFNSPKLTPEAHVGDCKGAPNWLKPMYVID